MLPLALALACYNPGDAFRPIVTEGVPSVYHVGTLEVLTPGKVDDMLGDPTSVPESVHFGRLGADVNPGKIGGATYEFEGTGDVVCVIADPEAVYWNYTVKTGPAGDRFKYEDVYNDDGDVDISVGLTAYYTGSPGVEIGDFNANYTDASGVDHTIAFNECSQTNLFGSTGVHGGRGSVEYCEVDTSGREGVKYTVLLRTYSLPMDDSVLNFGTVVYDGACSEIAEGFVVDGDPVTVWGPSECTLKNEVANADGGTLPAEKAWFPELEIEVCGGGKATNKYCEEHMDDDSPPCFDPYE